MALKYCIDLVSNFFLQHVTKFKRAVPSFFTQNAPKLSKIFLTYLSKQEVYYSVTKSKPFPGQIPLNKWCIKHTMGED